jgi:uncharacterized protein
MIRPAARPTDHAGLVVLSFAECLELVASQPVGRVAFVVDGDLEVFPVNHCVVDRTVAFRTAGGSKFTAAFRGSAMAFEVDSYDARRRRGWSVLVKGRTERVTDDALLARLEATGLRTWSPSAPRAEWVVIRADEVSGRRL